jgi:hypothetical protein
MFYDALTNNFERAEGYKTLQLIPPPSPVRLVLGEFANTWFGTLPCLLVIS